MCSIADTEHSLFFECSKLYIKSHNECFKNNLIPKSIVTDEDYHLMFSTNWCLHEETKRKKIAS